jgi:hypothetical protein
MFAGRLGIVRVIPRTSYFTSTTSVATCQETRLMGRAEMKREGGDLLWDWRLIEITQVRQFGTQDNEADLQTT